MHELFFIIHRTCIMDHRGQLITFLGYEILNNDSPQCRKGNGVTTKYIIIQKQVVLFTL